MDGNSYDPTLLVPRPLRRVPADVAVTVLLAFAVVAVVSLPVVRATPVRLFVTVPFVLVGPGYAIVAALFPENTDHGPDVVERVILTVGLSAAAVGLLVLALDYTPVTIRLGSVVIALVGATLGACAVATYRRRALSADRRLSVPVQTWWQRLRASAVPDSRTDAVINVALLVAVVLAAGSVTYAIALDGESYTELGLLTHDQENGTLVADDFPSNLTLAENGSFVIDVQNHEYDRITYSVAVELQRVETTNGTTRIVETDRLDSFDPTLDHGERWRHNYTFSPTMTADRLRLAVLLSKDGSVGTSDPQQVYRSTHLWLNVSATGPTDADIEISEYTPVGESGD